MNSDEQELSQTLKLKNAINTFYKLKGDYDNAIRDIKRKIAKKTHLSVREKREEFKRAKPKCINCKRPVGTIFDVKYNKETESRIAKAICGDKVDKCLLNIEINLGSIKDLAQEVNEYHQKIVEIKDQIIIIKNNILFGYASPDEAVGKFNELKEGLGDATEAYESLLVSYNIIYEHSIKKQPLIDMERKIYEYVKHIKNLMTDYNKENNTQYVTDAVETYVTDMLPLLQRYREMRYPVCFVENLDNKCKLIQRQITPEQTEIDLGVEEAKVTSFVTGVATTKKPKKPETSENEVALEENDFIKIGE